MERPRLPLDQVLSVIGLTARFVGDDPSAPTHLRLAVADRAVLWPLRPEHGELVDEALSAVAVMIANASELTTTNRNLKSWVRLHGFDPNADRTLAAFQLSLVLDDIAERLLTRPVLHGLHESTAWRAHLDVKPRQPVRQ